MQFWKGLDRTEKVSFGQRLAGKRWRLGCSGDPRVVQGASFRAGGVRTEPLVCASQVPALCGHRCVGLPSPTGTSFKLAVQPLIPQDAEGQVVSPEASAPLLSSTEHRGAGPCRARLRSPRAQGPLGGVCAAPRLRSARSGRPEPEAQTPRLPATCPRAPGASAQPAAERGSCRLPPVRTNAGLRRKLRDTLGDLTRRGRSRRDSVWLLRGQQLLAPGYPARPKGHESALSASPMVSAPVTGGSGRPREIKPAIVVNLREDMQLKFLAFFFF